LPYEFNEVFLGKAILEHEDAKLAELAHEAVLHNREKRAS
jgi:hypothetical protein